MNVHIAAPDLNNAQDSGNGFTLRCGEVEINRSARRLRRRGQALNIGTRAFDLLLALIDGRDRPQSAEALRSAVWGDRAVGDNNLRVQLTHLRRLLGDDAILFVHGRGYQLAGAAAPSAVGEVPGELPKPRLGNLPEALWPVLGRGTLLGEVVRQLSPGDRLTLLGPGGAGKTVLALAAADQAAAGFADGAWWVDLAALHDASQLANAVTAALQRPTAMANALDRLAHALAEKHLLLVLDNCEHLQAAVAELSDRLLRTATRVTLLATSRVPLRSACEKQIVVTALSLPDPTRGEAAWPAAHASGAVALFEARARAADPRFRLTPANAGKVIEICHRLEGHALAIVLAAARVPAIGLDALPGALKQQLLWSQPGAPGSAAPQHLSLQGMLDWSYSLMGRSEQRLLRLLGVFSGSFSLAAMAAVAGGTACAAPEDVQQPLEMLIDHGLVYIDSAGLLGGSDTPALYTMHATTRLYAHQQLERAGEREQALSALGRHLLTLFWYRRSGSRPPSEQSHVRLDLLADAQTVIESAAETDPGLALQLCERACTAWCKAGHHALVRRLASRLLAQPTAATLANDRIELLLALCLVDWELEDLQSVLDRVAEVMALLDRPEAAGQPHALMQRSLALSWRGNVHARGSDTLALAERLYREVLDLSQRAGSTLRMRETLRNLGWVLQAQHRFAEARPVLVQALEMADLEGDSWGQMVCHENLGELAFSSGELDQAASHFERALVLARREPDPYRAAQALVLLGITCSALQASTRAQASIHEALQLSIRHEFVRLQTEACSALAALLVRTGQPLRAHAALCASRQWRARRAMEAGSLLDAVDAETEQCTTDTLSSADRRAAEALGDLLTLSEALEWAAAPCKGAG